MNLVAASSEPILIAIQAYKKYKQIREQTTIVVNDRKKMVLVFSLSHLLSWVCVVFDCIHL